MSATFVENHNKICTRKSRPGRRFIRSNKIPIMSKSPTAMKAVDILGFVPPTTNIKSGTTKLSIPDIISVDFTPNVSTKPHIPLNPLLKLVLKRYKSH